LKDKKNTFRKLKEICSINPPLGVKVEPDTVVSFLPMEDVAENGGRIGYQARQRSQIALGLTAFKNDDVLIAKITPCFENEKGWLANGLEAGVGFGSTELHVIRCGKEILPRFVYAHTLLPQFRLRGKRYMTGSAGQQRVPASFLNDYVIWVPDLQLQSAICRVDVVYERSLLTFDRLIAAKREQKRGLMQQLLTGKLRFPGFTEPWAALTINSLLASDCSGAWGEAPNESNSGTVILRSTNITNDGRIDLQSTVCRILDHKKCNDLLIRAGDILLERSGGTDTRPVGRVAFARMDLDACFSNFLQRLRPNEEVVDPRFLFWQLFKLHAKGATNRLQAQTTGIRNLMFRAYLEQPVLIPERREQTRICDLIQLVSNEIELLEQQRAAFAAQRRGLMEKLLSGEIDIQNPKETAA
jgi:type I restriction enzyme S subunit